MNRISTIATWLAPLTTLGCNAQHQEVHENPKCLTVTLLRRDTESVKDHVTQLSDGHAVYVTEAEYGSVTEEFTRHV
jgi:hypothetical protein